MKARCASLVKNSLGQATISDRIAAADTGPIPGTVAQRQQPGDLRLHQGDHRVGRRGGQIQPPTEPHASAVEPRQPRRHDPDRFHRRLNKPQLLIEPAILTYQRAADGGAHQIQPPGDPHPTQPKNRNAPGLHLTRTQQQRSKHLGTQHTLISPRQRVPHAVSGRIPDRKSTQAPPGKGAHTSRSGSPSSATITCNIIDQPGLLQTTLTKVARPYGTATIQDTHVLAACTRPSRPAGGRNRALGGLQDTANY